MTGQQIATEILNQLGGNKFVAMVNPKQMAYGKRSLSFKIGKNASKANIVNIELKSDDTYKVDFLKLRGIELKTMQEFDGIYAEDLRSIFEQTTQLYTAL